MPAEKHRLFRLKLFFRLVASVPSLVGSLFESNLGTILDTAGAHYRAYCCARGSVCDCVCGGPALAGTVAIVIAFVVPTVLRHESIRRCIDVAKHADRVRAHSLPCW